MTIAAATVEEPLNGLMPIDPPEPDHTPEEMLARADAMRDVLRERQAAAEAVDIIFRTAGSSASKRDAMIGRYWRNIGELRGHLAHQSDSAAINYGRTHFGLSPVGIA